MSELNLRKIPVEKLLRELEERIITLERDLVDSVRSEISLSETVNVLKDENDKLRYQLDESDLNFVKP